MSYDDFFRKATRTANQPNGRTPYLFQRRFAEDSDLPHLLRAPTGSGKTATAVLGWLYRWVNRTQYRSTPRRLVYCLPMRVLVEQSEREAKAWITNLRDQHILQDDVEVHVLMGGVDAERWFLHPERPAILIGTQDMLLSRALNRGYAASRFHWPIDFGLLNNDCLWVFDELQLMGSGVSTSAQLAGLRQKLQTFGACPTVWMSATMERSWLGTYDLRDSLPGLRELNLSPEELSTGELGRRMTAKKVLRQVKDMRTSDKAYPKTLANTVAVAHQPGTITLIIVNTVDRVKEVYDALPAAFRTAKKDQAEYLLIHSRYRPRERRERNGALKQPPGPAGKVVVATQVVEAGVDISARVLFTELAPWPSLVQRFGRCHRYGEFTSTGNHGDIYWVEVPRDEKAALPYTAADLETAYGYLTGAADASPPRPSLEGADISPNALEVFQREYQIILPFEHKHVLRRRDLLDLFDTSPDLSGNDIDIARFVRGDDPETDVKVFWRKGPPDNNWDAIEKRRQSPRWEELCSVPISSFKKEFLEGGRSAYRFDHLDNQWRELTKKDAGSVLPGQTFWIPADQGGYDPERGWTPTAGPLADALLIEPPVETDDPTLEDAAGADPNSETPNNPRTIAQHTADVCKQLSNIFERLPELPREWHALLQTSARWHDTGKAHSVFQTAVHRFNGEPPERQHWAKSGSKGRLHYEQRRRYFRHELASALAILQHRKDWPFAAAYLIAAHHGKVRLSIRALPGESPPDDKPEALFALGICDGDPLPSVDLGGDTCPETTLDLSPMRLTHGSPAVDPLKLHVDEVVELAAAVTHGSPAVDPLKQLLRRYLLAEDDMSPTAHQPWTH